MMPDIFPGFSRASPSTFPTQPILTFCMVSLCASSALAKDSSSLLADSADCGGGRFSS